jgi:hypothetical protein
VNPISFADMHGFESDPFASTNSEDEDLLEDYFVPPPYFSSVLGDPQTPKSRVIFAPRGGGKTAQRRMIEIRCLDPDLPFVCITYDHFDTGNLPNLSLLDHLQTLCKLLTVTILEHLDRNPDQANDLSDHEKRIVKVAAETFASGMSQSEYSTAFSAVKSLGDRATEFWHKYGGVIAAGINAAMKKAGLDDISIPAQLRSQAQHFEESARYFYEQLVDLITGPLRGGSIYILVDKVDETAATNAKPAAAWSLIENLIQDLPTVEKKGVAFKFFLWDQLRAQFYEANARGDRIQPAILEGWDALQLRTMLTRRLSAYSNGKVTNFNDLLEQDSTIDGHLLLSLLAKGSPREMIRMAESIAAEHTRVRLDKHRITDEEVVAGIKKYSSARAEELAGLDLDQLKKIRRITFTRKHLRETLQISKTDAKQTLAKWTALGLINKLGDVSSENGSSKVLYGLSDLRILLALNIDIPLRQLLSDHAFECSNCSAITITDQDQARCLKCGNTFSVGEVLNLADVVVAH